MLSAERNQVLTQVGRGTPMGELMRRYWIPALYSFELEKPGGAPVRVRLLGEDLIAFRNTAGEVGLLGALCPHRAAPLYYGRNIDEGLVCVYHGWKFDVQGRCLAMPNVPPEVDIADRIRHTAYPVREFNGVIWAYMGPPDTMPADLPPLEWISVPDSHREMSKQLINANYCQTLEGDFDPSHISFLHSTLDAYEDFNDRMARKDETSAPEPGERLTSEMEKLYWYREPRAALTVMPTPYGMFSGARRDAGPTTHYYRFNQFIMPFIAGPPHDADSSAQCNMWVPVDDHHTMVWRINFHPDKPLGEAERAELQSGIHAHVEEDGYLEPTAAPGSRWLPKRNRDNDYGLDRESPLFAGIEGIWAQDRACTEGMGSIIDRTQERLVSSDAPIALIRRILLHAARALQEHGTPPPAQADFPAMTAIPTTCTPRSSSWPEVAQQVLDQVQSTAARPASSAS